MAWGELRCVITSKVVVGNMPFKCTLPVLLKACTQPHQTMRIPLQTPEDIRLQIWKELGRASLDRHHEWRTPVLASTDANGLANARTVVLRRADAVASQFEMYTDKRSPKVAELKTQPLAMLVFWSSRLSWQLRVRVRFKVVSSGAHVESLWQGVKQSPAALDYLSATAPGDALASNASASAAAHTSPFFALLRAQVLQMDWLELSRHGHRRAQLSDNTWVWVTP